MADDQPRPLAPDASADAVAVPEAATVADPNAPTTVGDEAAPDGAAILTPEGQGSIPRGPHPPLEDRIKRPKPANHTPAYDFAAEDLQALRRAVQNSHLVQLAFYFLDYILRAQTALFEQIHSKRALPRIIPALAILCGLLASIYGVVMGSYNGPLQAIASGIKMPILFLFTAIICVPSLYTFNVLLGQRFRFLQTLALMVITLTTTSILLVSLAPIALFFTITTPENYQFLLLMHVCIFGLCGFYGVRYLYRGSAYIAFRMEQPLNNLLLRIWIVIYGIVGMQLAWRLRPFVGSQGMPFQILRDEVDGNFYLAVWKSLLALFAS
ncbi:MAG: actin-binding WH2 domain-containing protein [Cyanobacteria bacterium]|nr:actin-binding WH2 domain-containing protein [Cyanobacteriota bacterium]